MTQRAFTLVEVLVAGAVMLLVLLIAGGALWTGGRTSTRGIEKLDEISRLARLGEYFKKTLRFATSVQHELPEPGHQLFRIRFVEEISPAEGSRVERDATFRVAPRPGGGTRVDIDIAGRTQAMEFERLDVRLGVAGNLITVVLDGGKGRAIEVSVASPYMVALSGVAGNPLDGLASASDASTGGAPSPAGSAGGRPPLPGAGPGLRGSTAAAPPSLRSGQPPGSPGEVASLPAGLAGRSTLTNTSRTGVKSADGARPGPANSTEAPPLARELPPKNVPDEPDVVATDDTGAVLTAPPTKPASGPALKPTLVRPTGIAPAPPAARDTGQEPVAEPPAERPAERPSTPGAKRRQRPPLGPKEIEALRRSRIGTGGKEPDPAEQDTTKAPRDRPPRNSQTMETPAKPDAGVDAPF